MAHSLEPFQPDDDNDDDDLPPPIPAAFQQGATSAAPPSINPQRVRKRSNSWTAPAPAPPPLPSAPLPSQHASQSSSKLLQKSLEALRSGQRAGQPPSDADIAFDQLVAAATEAKVGVGLRISAAAPVTCTATIEGQSASRHPLSKRFLGSKITMIDGVDVSSSTQDQVRDLILGPFGSVCSVQFIEGSGDVFTAALLRANPEFFTSYEEQVKRVGSMVSPSLAAAMQAQNAALQQKVADLRVQLKQAEDHVDQCTRTLESAHQNVKMQEESLALSRILEEEGDRSEIFQLEARVQYLTREVALKDSIISKHDVAVLDSARDIQAALKAEVAVLQSRCAVLEKEKVALGKENMDFSSERKALVAKLAATQSAAAAQQSAVNDGAIRELMHLLSEFEAKVPKLSSRIALLEVELLVERKASSSRLGELEESLARESCLNDRLQQMEEQLQHATARASQALTASLAPKRRHDAVFDCFEPLADDAWAAVVHRHAVSMVVSSAVERTVARANSQSLFERLQSSESRSPPAATALACDAVCQAGCTSRDTSNFTATLALHLSQCFHPLAKAAGLPVPPELCNRAVDGLMLALLTNDCSTCTLTDIAAWCGQAAEKMRCLQLRAVAAEGERDALLHFRDQLQQENSRLVTLQQKQQRRHEDMERAMLASVNDVQQLSLQMGSLLTIVKDKSTENADLVRQVARLKQLITIQNDLRLQIEGQKQQLLQYQVLERQSLQLKVC
jgi:hypothetical protein